MQQLNSFCIHQTPGTAGKQLTSSFRLDTCSIVQVRKSQKADSVHVDVAFSVGENSTSRWEESDFWVLLTALIYFTVPAFIHTEVLITKCWSDFDCRLTAEDQHHDSSLFLLRLPVNDSGLSGKLDSSSKGIKCCSTLPAVLWKSCNSNRVCLTDMAACYERLSVTQLKYFHIIVFVCQQ